MAFTPDQQYLADMVSLNKQVSDTEACCLGMGGVVDELNEECDLSSQGWGSIILSESCVVAEQLAEDEPSTDNQNGNAGGWNWSAIGNFFNETLETTLPVFFPPNEPTTTTGGGGTNVIITNPDDKGMSTKAIVAIVVTVITLAIAVYLIRRKR